MEHLSKLWRIYLDSARKTPNLKNQIVVRNNNPKLTRKFGTGDRILIYKFIINCSLWILYLRQIKLENNHKVTHAHNYPLRIIVL